MEMLIQVLNTLVGLYIYALILRFVLRASDADYFNPITQGILKLTNPWMSLFKFVPIVQKRLELGSVIGAWALQFLFLFLVVVLSQSAMDIVYISIVALYKIALAFIAVYFWSLIIVVILSWIMMLGANSSAIEPMYILLDQITQPMLRPFQRLMPDLGGIDISPIFAILALQVLEYMVKYIFQQLI